MAVLNLSAKKLGYLLVCVRLKLSKDRKLAANIRKKYGELDPDRSESLLVRLELGETLLDELSPAPDIKEELHESR